MPQDTTNDRDDRTDTGYEQLATMLAAAYMAYYLDTTYQTAEKNLRRTGEGPSEYWIDLATRVSRDVSESMNAQAAARRAQRGAK